MGAPPLHDHYPLWPGPPYRHAPAPSARRGPTRAIPRAFGRRELGVAVALPILADVVLWSTRGFSAGGFGLALLLGLVPPVVLLSVRSWKPTARLGIITALLALTVLRSVFDPTAGTVLAGLLLLVGFTLALRGRRVFVPTALHAALGIVTKLPSRLTAAFAGVKKVAPRTRLANVSVLPIVVPVGLIAVFGGLFALANPVIAEGVARGWAAFTKIVAFPSVPRVLFWILALVVGVSLVRPAHRLERGSERAGSVGEASTTGLLVARNALVGLNALFLVEIALDARYLWSGSPPSGMDTQRYAHEGAFWLTLALVMLTVVVGVMFRGPLSHDPRAAKTRRMAHAWMFQGMLLAAGTYRRIAIHVERSGLSDLRIVGILGTTLVAVGVVLVGLKLHRQKTFTWLLRRQLDAFALVAVFYAVAPTHLLSARVNLARIQSGELRPLLHVFSQSHKTESAATFLPLLEHSDPRVREGVAALLSQERARLRNASAQTTTWRERDLATTAALAALDRAEARIASALGTADADEARRTLLDVVHVANGDGYLEARPVLPASTVRGDDPEVAVEAR